MADRLSVVICTRDRPDLIGQAVASVARCDHPDFEIHIMDQSTTDATREVIDALRAEIGERPPIVYHHLDQAGLSRAYNLGIRATSTDVVACTDDDVVVPRDWLSAIARAFAADPRLGLLYGQVLVPESLRDHGPDVVVPSLVWTEPERLHRDERNFKVWGMGANMAIRRATVEEVGGFDEALGGGAPLRSSQDFDFALRVYRKGWAVLLDPAVQVDHYGARSTDQWPGTEVAYGIGDGAFYMKHIRCRDLLAAWLLARRVGRLAARSLVRTVTRRRLVGLGPYGRSLFTGVRQSLRWDVDRSTRLYRENDKVRIGVTQANAISGAPAGGGTTT